MEIHVAIAAAPDDQDSSEECERHDDTDAVAERVREEGARDEEANPDCDENPALPPRGLFSNPAAGLRVSVVRHLGTIGTLPIDIESAERTN